VNNRHGDSYLFCGRRARAAALILVSLRAITAEGTADRVNRMKWPDEIAKKTAAKLGPHNSYSEVTPNA